MIGESRVFVKNDVRGRRVVAIIGGGDLKFRRDAPAGRLDSEGADMIVFTTIGVTWAFQQHDCVT